MRLDVGRIDGDFILVEHFDVTDKSFCGNHDFVGVAVLYHDYSDIVGDGGHGLWHKKFINDWLGGGRDNCVAFGKGTTKFHLEGPSAQWWDPVGRP